MKGPTILRPAVQRFAEEMEKRLAAHDDERGSEGWRGDDLDSLLDRATQELGELKQALNQGRSERKIIREAADVANFCMMIAEEVAR